MATFTARQCQALAYEVLDHAFGPEVATATGNFSAKAEFEPTPAIAYNAEVEVNAVVQMGQRTLAKKLGRENAAVLYYVHLESNATFTSGVEAQAWLKARLSERPGA